jgi:ATP-dependent protease HslVU (ClpYQ) peptidase subunit
MTTALAIHHNGRSVLVADRQLTSGQVHLTETKIVEVDGAQFAASGGAISYRTLREVERHNIHVGEPVGRAGLSGLADTIADRMRTLRIEGGWAPDESGMLLIACEAGVATVDTYGGAHIYAPTSTGHTIEAIGSGGCEARAAALALLYDDPARSIDEVAAIALRIACTLDPHTGLDL